MIKKYDLLLSNAFGRGQNKAKFWHRCKILKNESKNIFLIFFSKNLEVIRISITFAPA